MSTKRFPRPGARDTREKTAPSCNNAAPTVVYLVGKVVMGIDDAKESRLMAGAMPTDDPTWGEVSAFLVAVESTYPETPTATLEAGHLAAVSRESRRLRAGHQPGRRRTMKDLITLKTHRLLIGGLAAAIIALTAGVGVASAMGIDPLANLLPAAPAETTPAPEPSSATPTPAVTEEPSDEPGEDADEQDDATPTAAPTRDDETDEAEDADEADHEKAGDSGRTHDKAESDDNESDDDSEDADEPNTGEEHETRSTSSAHQGDDSGDQGDDDPESD